MGPFSISIRPMGPDGYLWDHSPSPSDLWDPTAHLHPTRGTRRLACHLTLAIHHKSLCLVLYPFDVYKRDPSTSDLWDLTLWDPSASDLWDPMAYVSRLPVGPFSISIRPVGLDGLCTTLGPRSQTQDPEQGMDRLHYCARRLVVLICLWSPYSSIFSVYALQVDLYIGYPLQMETNLCPLNLRRRRIPGVLCWLRCPFGG